MDIQSVSSTNHDMVVQIRALFYQCDPNLSEEIKYGGLIFLQDNQLVAGIFVYKQHISIEFGAGSTFDDPHGVLEGKGKQRRHIKIKQPEDIASKQVDFYIGQALS